MTTQPRPQDLLDVVVEQRNAFMNEVAAGQAVIRRLEGDLAVAHARIAELEKAAAESAPKKKGKAA